MIVAAHAVAGATIGCLLKSKTLCRWLLLAVLGIFSHIILDFVPHWDYPFSYFWILLDLLLTVAVVWFMIIITKMKLPIIVGALFGMIPDLEHLLVDFGIMEQQVFISHVPWFPHGEWALPGGLT